jgi:SH3 domain protein
MLILREEPSPHTSIVGVLLKNTRISVLDNVQGWYKIRLDDGKIGYVYGPMLKEKD